MALWHVDRKLPRIRPYSGHAPFVSHGADYAMVARRARMVVSSLMMTPNLTLVLIFLAAVAVGSHLRHARGESADAEHRTWCVQLVPTSSDRKMNLRVYPSMRSPIIAELHPLDSATVDLDARCEDSAFEERKVCDVDGDWIKVIGVHRMGAGGVTDYLEVSGWVGRKFARIVRLPEGVRGCAAE
jgi:hypothetical protein